MQYWARSSLQFLCFMCVTLTIQCINTFLCWVNSKKFYKICLSLVSVSMCEKYAEKWLCYWDNSAQRFMFFAATTQILCWIVLFERFNWMKHLHQEVGGKRILCQIIPWFIYILALFLFAFRSSTLFFFCGDDGNRSDFKECECDGAKMEHGW